ncbi:MAG TPA: tetratricopeptide repeat protein [Candidatus Obscuribacterales bacterium]
MNQAPEWLSLAAAAAGRQDWLQAESLLAPHGSHPAALHLLGLIRRAQGRPSEALRCFEGALAAGGITEILPEIARLRHDAGELTNAHRDYLAALAAGLKLEDQDIHRFAHCLRAGGEHRQALALYRDLLGRYPEHAMLWMHSGNAWLDLGQLQQAQAAYARSLELDPENALVYHNLARCLQVQGRLDEAEAAIRACLAREPGLAAGWNLLGSLLQARGDTAEALAAFRQGLALAPDDALSLNNLGTCHQAQYQGPEAEAAYRAALQRLPGLWEARLNLAQLLRERNRPDQALAELGPLLAAHPLLRWQQAFVLPIVHADAGSPGRWRQHLQQALDQLEAEPVPLNDPLTQVGRLPFYLPYLGSGDRPLLEQLARTFLRACPSLNWQSPHCRHARKPGPWRIGVLSGYFYNHTVYHLFGYLLPGLVAAGFELTALYTGAKQDEFTAMARSQARRFVTLPPDLDAARRQIAGLELDLLLYLDLGMDPMTYFLGFARLAPLQCNTWGHPLTSGLPAIDVFLSSQGLDPPGGEANYSESLVELSGFFGHWRSPEVLSASPADFGLPAGRLYLCPQSLFKLHPDYDELLARLLARDPDGRLVLLEGLYPDWKRDLLTRWDGLLDTSRISWLGRLSMRDYVRLLDCGQVMLETRPFGSGLTMLQSFAQGVPVVAWPTDALKGRVTYGICRELDWLDGVADSGDAYVARACELAMSWDTDSKREMQRRYQECLRPEGMVRQMSAVLAEHCERRFNG